jgi:hypothetical protein
MQLEVETDMATQDQNSLESEHISLLHEKILQQQQQQQHACNDQTRPRHTSNTKIQRIKPLSTAPPAMDANDQQPVKFHGFPLSDLDGDTQPMPSHYYKDFSNALEDTQIDDDDHDEEAPHTEQDTPQIDLMQHWQQSTYHELSSDEDEDKDEGQYFLSSVARPTFPKTPATAVRMPNNRRDVIPSTTSTKTPGSGGLSAFAFVNATSLTSTQLFQATQSPSSPVPDVPRSDPVLSRPSPNLRQSSPGMPMALSSPLKGSAQSPIRSLNLGKRPSRPSTRDGTVQSNPDLSTGLEEQGENEWEYHDREGVSLDEDLQSPASESMDEYDELAQSMRFSQPQVSSSPRQDPSDGNDDHGESSSRTSTPSSQQQPQPNMLHASVPSGRQQSSHQLPATQSVNGHVNYAIADSQPTRYETQSLPPPLVEPSSMSSFVPGSYPLSQTTQRLNVLKRDATDSSSIPRPPATTSQITSDTQNRLPSSPPQLPTESEHVGQVEPCNLLEQSRDNGHVVYKGASSPLAETRLAASQKIKQLKEDIPQQSSNVPETDPEDEKSSSNQHPTVPLTHQQTWKANANTLDVTSPVIPAFSPFKHRASQLQSQRQIQSSTSSAESPRKAAGILNFADIATDPTPLEAASKDIDLNIDIFSNDDHDFMEIMSSPPAKKMRLYGKSGKTFERKAKATPKSPVKAAVRTVTFPDQTVPEEEQDRLIIATSAQKKPQQLQSSRDGNMTPEPPRGQEQATSKELSGGVTADISTPSKTLPDRSAKTLHTEAVAYENLEQDSSHIRQLKPNYDNDQQTTPSARREVSGNYAAVKAHEALLARRTREMSTSEAKGKPGRLVRPKRRTSEHSPSRTPIVRRQEVVEAPRSKLSHVERVSQGESPQQESASVSLNTVVDNKTPHHQQTATTSVEQPQKAGVTVDVSMTDAGSERGEDSNKHTESKPEISQPDRVLALFKGTGQAYYPATCLGAATLDGLKLRIRFDDGTITQLDSFRVRRLELRRGDQVKVDLKGMRNKVYVVVGFQDKLQNALPESYPGTDIHGYETVQLVPKDRDSIAAVPQVETATLIKVPITSTYLTQTMWIRFEDRHYLSSTASMATVTTGNSSRPQTPVPQHTTLDTPASRTRRGTLTCINSSVLTSPLPPGRGIFSGMAFAVSYSADSSEKNRVLELIQSQGGLTLEKGFDELFSVRDLGDTLEGSPPPTSSSSNDSDALILSSRAQTLGFVALIADKHSRRAKYVQALALSLPCLSGRWILDSVASTTPLPWSKYLLPAGESAFLSGAIRSRTLPSYLPTTAKLAQTVQEREKLLQGGRVLLVSAGAGGRKWEARRAYAFLTIALGASTVRRVSGLESAKRILDSEKGWGWVYVEGTVEEAEGVLFGQDGSVVSAAAEDSTTRKGRKRKRDEVQEKEKLVAVGRGGKVRIVGDEFVVQSLILGDLMV